MGIPPLVAQTLVEYGLITSLSARIVALRNRIEWYIGQGNSEYLLYGLLAVLLYFLIRRRR